MVEQFFAYTGHVSVNSSWATVLNENGIREMTNRGQVPARLPFALDNGAYIDWRAGTPFDEKLYLKTLKNCIPLNPDFIIIPDKVAGGLESLVFSLSWIPRLRKMMPNFIPLALAVQDGMEPEDIEPHIREFDVLFLGGSRPWKYRTGERWCEWAQRQGIPVHIGAIGSMIGVRWAKAINATSIDSTSPLWSKRAMRNWLQAINEYPPLFHHVVTPKIRPNQKPPTRKKGQNREDLIGSIEYTMQQKMSRIVVDLVNFNTQQRASFLVRALNLVSFPSAMPVKDAFTSLIKRLEELAAGRGSIPSLEALHDTQVKSLEKVKVQAVPKSWEAMLQGWIAVGKAAVLLTSRFDQKNIIQAVHLLALAGGFNSNSATKNLPDQEEILSTIENFARFTSDINAPQNQRPSSQSSQRIPPPRQSQSAPPPSARVVKSGTMDDKKAMNLLDLRHDLSEATIKSAFRKKALEHHPDRGGDKEKFQDVRNAYEHLMQKNFGRIAGAKNTPKKKASRVGGEDGFQEFHDALMGNVQINDLNDIRRQFGDAHIHRKISDEEFDILESEAAAVYAMLRLETASLPPFTVRTVGSQAVLGQWIYRLQNTRGVDEFRRAWRDVEDAYKSGKLSKFDVMTLQPIAKPLFDEMFHKDWPGTFGYIVDPRAVVSGRAKKGKKGHRVGGMEPATEILVQRWKDGLDIDWLNGTKNFNDYHKVVEEVKQVAKDPEAPSAFLEWLYDQNKNARIQLPKAAVYDVSLYTRELLSNPSITGRFALQLVADTGYSSYIQTHRIITLLENPGFSLMSLEDAGFMERVFKLMQKVHNIEIPGMMEYLKQVPVFAEWLGPQVKYYTFKRLFKEHRTRFSPYEMPESVIVYGNGVVDLNFRTIKGQKNNQRLYRTMADVQKRYGPEFVNLTDQERPDSPKIPSKAKKKTPKISGVARVSRVGAVSSSTQILLDQWKNGEKFDPFQIPIDPAKDQGKQLDEKIKEAASSPEVPSAFLMWLLDSQGMYHRELVMKNPNLSLEDAFTALDERKFKNHWKRSQAASRGTPLYNNLYIQLPAALWLLDNFSFQLFLMEDPSLYERLFKEVQHLGRVANKDLYREQVDQFLAHPIMAKWLGASKTFTFKKAKRDKQNEDRSELPLGVTVYENGVVRVEHLLSDRKERTPLFRSLEEFLDRPGWTMTPSRFLAMSDQASAKRKAK